MRACQLNCRASALVLFFVTMKVVQMGFSDERPRKPDSKKKADEIAAFKLIGKTGLYGATPFVFVYHSPYEWRSEEYNLPIFKRVFICDGKTAWSYLVEKNKITDIKKWDAEKAVKKYGQKLTYEHLMGYRGTPCLALANPAHPRWKKEFSFPGYDFWDVIRKREEMVNKTATVSVVYEREGLPLIQSHWFGKEDGLIRKEALSLAGDSLGETVVEKVVINPEVSDDLFQFTPPPGAKVIDKTDALFKAIETDKQLYQKFAERKRKSGKDGEQEEKGKKKKDE